MHGSALPAPLLLHCDRCMRASTASRGDTASGELSAICVWCLCALTREVGCVPPHARLTVLRSCGAGRHGWQLVSRCPTLLDFLCRSLRGSSPCPPPPPAPLRLLLPPTLRPPFSSSFPLASSFSSHLPASATLAQIIHHRARNSIHSLLFHCILCVQYTCTPPHCSSNTHAHRLSTTTTITPRAFPCIA